MRTNPPWRTLLPIFKTLIYSMVMFRRFISSFATLSILFALLRPGGLAQAQEVGSELLSAPIVAPSDSGAYRAINQLPASIRRSMPFAREFAEFARHAGSSGTVDNAAYQREFEVARGDMLRSSERAMKGTSPLNILGGSWLNIGLTGSDTVPSAGITTAIVFDPQNPAIMYAGSSGGVWKSVDTGANWFPLTDNLLPNLTVATIAVDPVNTDTLYVGTGNCNAGVPPYNGTGLYRSTDDGKSFQQLNIPNQVSFVKVLVDPAEHNVVLAASFPTMPGYPSSNSVYRSTDAGNTWKAVFTQGMTWDLLATSDGTLYLSSSAGIYKSTNHGATWSNTTSTSGYPSNLGRSALASPTDAPNKVFVLATDGGGSLVHLFETTNAGSTWDSLKIESPIYALFNPSVNAQGWYDLVLAVTPHSVTNDTLYIEGVKAFKFVGTDAQMQDGTAGMNEYSYYSAHSGGGSGYPHVDHHSFAFNPVNSNIVYDGDDGGLWVNYAAGSNDVSHGGGWQLHSHNMITNRFYHIGLDTHNPAVTYGGAQDQGLWKIVPGSDPESFPDDHLGDALQPLVSSQNSNLVFAEGPQALIYKGGGTSWTQTADSAQGVNDAKPNWEAPFKMSPVPQLRPPVSSAASILYVGRQFVWQTSDGGSHWKKLPVSFGTTNDGMAYCSAIGLPAWNVDVIYAAGGGNKFALSTNFGVSWTPQTYPDPSGGVVTSINTASTDTNFVLVSLWGTKNKVMMSENRGKTWTDVSGLPGYNIPGSDTNKACNVMSIAVDSLNPLTTWYAGTDFGLFVTDDAGQHWWFAGPGLFPCRDVQVAPNRVTLRVATFGRGIWENTLPMGVESTSLSATKVPDGTELSWYVDGEPAGATFYVERSVDGDAFANIGTVAGFGASSERHEYSFADNTKAPGTYLYQIHEVDANGAQRYSNHVELHYGTDGVYFSQPYPNPFMLNSSNGASSQAITLNFELPARDNVLVRIYSIDGTLVRTLLDHPLDGGPHTLAWNARDASGDAVAPGAYLCSIQTTHSGTVVNKIMIVRQ